MGDISHFSSLRQELVLGAADRRGNVSLGRGLTLVWTHCSLRLQTEDRRCRG